MLTIYFIVKLVNLLFSVCFATGYIHSGEIRIFRTYPKFRGYRRLSLVVMNALAVCR